MTSIVCYVGPSALSGAAGTNNCCFCLRLGFALSLKHTCCVLQYSQAPQLQQVDLRSNPLAQAKVYQQQLLSGLPHLGMLDGQKLQQAVGSIAGTLTMQLLKEGVTLWHSGSGGLLQLLHMGCDVCFMGCCRMKGYLEQGNTPSPSVCG